MKVINKTHIIQNIGEDRFLKISEIYTETHNKKVYKYTDDNETLSTGFLYFLSGYLTKELEFDNGRW